MRLLQAPVFVPPGHAVQVAFNRAAQIVLVDEINRIRFTTGQPYEFVVGGYFRADLSPVSLTPPHEGNWWVIAADPNSYDVPGPELKASYAIVEV